MIKKSPLFNIFLLSTICYLLSTSMVFASNRCNQNIDLYIQEVVQNSESGFIKQLSSDITANKNIKKSSHETIKKLRSLRCELEKICHGITISFTEQSKIPSEDFKTLPFQCLHYPVNTFYNSEYTESYFKGEKALCPFSNSNNQYEYFTILKQCEQKIKNTESDLINFTKSQYLLAAKQEESNYYSAKLLYLSQKINHLGDQFQIMKQKIKNVYHAITCKCQK